ncbi:MAG: hypothetical protein RLY76_110 [Actinomycetota bacterium]
MSPITERDFQSELPLHPAAADLLSTFFDQGWADPSKIHRQSGQLRNLLNTAIESIASNLGIDTSELEVVGELGFGFQTAISGLMKNSDECFTYSAIDRQIVHAFARQHANNGFEIKELQPARNGLVEYSQSAQNSILCWQATNRETGVRQEFPPNSSYRKLFADMTAEFELNRLPEKWDCAIWDPRSFGGPQGIALIGISKNSGWRNPAPEMDNRRVYGSYSKPLLLVTSVALENWKANSTKAHDELVALNKIARRLLSERLPQVQIAGELEQSDPRYLAFSIPGVIAEELLRKVEVQGFLIDAGSACGGGALSPSHVLTAMGFPMQGNIRLTFKSGQSVESVTELVERIAASA